jgi:predicted RNA binding protein YcfA (HicA-like mRNA interferase family)
MKRVALLRHLATQACYIEREGGKHSVVKNETTGKRTTVPRHAEIPDQLCKEICKQLGILKP